MQSYYLLEEMQSLITAMKDRLILTPDGDFYKPDTIRGWKVARDNIAKYLASTGLNDIQLSEVNFRWCEDYRLWLLNNGHAKNTIGNYRSTLKALIRRLHAEGKIEYNAFGIRSETEITTAVFTTIDEIRTLLAHDFSNTPGLERIRDIYVCQCFLGLRVGDMIRLLKNLKNSLVHINGVWLIDVQTKKTGEVIAIPASNIVLEIAERRDYDFGKRLTQQYYYTTIKEVIKRAGLDRDILFRRTEGGERIERTVKYSDLVGTHTARRTFATNAYLAGVPVLDIMKITGHKSFNSFYRYIRCENTAVAIRLTNHEFFNIDFNE